MNETHDDLPQAKESPTGDSKKLVQFGAPKPADTRALLAEIVEFISEWEGRTEDLAFFPSPAGAGPSDVPTDPRQAIDDGLTRAAELVAQVREDDAEAVDYYHLSDCIVCELRGQVTGLLESAEACDPRARGVSGYEALTKALNQLHVSDHPLAVFRKVWAKWHALPTRGTDGTPLPIPDPLVDRLLTEAGVDPGLFDPGLFDAETAAPSERQPPDLAAENARLRELLAELLRETQRWTGHIRRFG